MDVSAEAADLVVKEGLQATETAVKLAGSGIKNVAALLLALSKQDYKVIGAGQRRAAGPRPKSSPQSFRSVRRTSRASGRWRQSSTVCCICRSASAGTTAALLPSFRRRPMPQISTVLWKSWATPCRSRRRTSQKSSPLAPSEKASNERGSISTASQERTTDDVRSSVLGKLEAMRQLSAERNTDRMKVKEHIR